MKCTGGRHRGQLASVAGGTGLDAELPLNSRKGNFLLDGTDTAGVWGNGTGVNMVGTWLGVDAIAEFAALTDTYSANFGGNGGMINAVFRSGTNQLHGSAYEFARNSALDASEHFKQAGTENLVPTLLLCCWMVPAN